ncbi:Uncharacterized protein DAT39_015685 [Clarias magur]|uniref:Uncharacterized protein n=1 Tax=Clarias magur TaxID=1594786 RepID=A0A8J4UBE8_CLAMG|nr:Uncharacterized protein DAT39_015685 [Clarias magur]
MTSSPGWRTACFSVYGGQVRMGYIQFQLDVSLAARDQGVVRQVYALAHSGATDHCALVISLECHLLCNQAQVVPRRDGSHARSSVESQQSIKMERLVAGWVRYLATARGSIVSEFRHTRVECG